MEGRTVIQWDKEDVEQAGLFKVDLLGLGALTHLHLCFDLLRRHRRLSLSLATLPREDAPTFDMICRADTVGLFQIESRAQMAMLGRLKPRNYYDLVIEISIVRPGPITGGMVHPYLRRRKGEEAVEYPHPCLIPVLKKTLGIPLFQEQVMQLAVVAADYTPGEADQLRRDMAAWRRSGRIERHHERLVSRMVGKGIRKEFAERVFQQIRGFGDYGFPESHAASFAHIAYATAYLKCHYPAEFTCALLNAQPMGFYSPSTIVNDARIHGIEIHPVSILESRWDCTLVPGPSAPGKPAGFAVRMGLRYVKGMGEGDRDKLNEATRQSPFSDLPDVIRRSGLRQDKLETLAEAGAFECFGLDRRSALWQIQGLAGRPPPRLPLSSRAPSPPFLPSEPPGEHRLGPSGRQPQLPGPPSEATAARVDLLGAAHRPPTQPDAGRPPRPLRGHGHLPPAPRDRTGRHLHDPGGRDGIREPGHLATDLPALFRPGQDPLLHGSHRQPPGGGGSHPPGRRQDLETQTEKNLPPPQKPRLPVGAATWSGDVERRLSSRRMGEAPFRRRPGDPGGR